MVKHPESPRLSYRKLLSALFLIKEAGYEVTAEGLSLILRGVKTEETIPFFENSVFSFLPSLSSKRIKARVHQLVRQGYLRLSYREEDEDYYLLLTDKGNAACKPSEVLRKQKAKNIVSKKNIRLI